MWRYSGIDAFDLESLRTPSRLARRASCQIERSRGRAAPWSTARAGVGSRGHALVVVVVVGGAPWPGRDGLDEASSGALGSRRMAEPTDAGTGSAGTPSTDLHDAFLADAVRGQRVPPKAVVSGNPSSSSTSVEARPGEPHDRRPACFPASCVQSCGHARQRRASSRRHASVRGRCRDPGDDVRCGPTAPRSRPRRPRGRARGRRRRPSLAMPTCRCSDPRWHSDRVQASRVGRDGLVAFFHARSRGAATPGCAPTRDYSSGQGPRPLLLAAYLGTGDQVHDFRTLQDHVRRAPRASCSSRGRWPTPRARSTAA